MQRRDTPKEHRIEADYLPPSMRPQRWQRDATTVAVAVEANGAMSHGIDPEPDLDDQIEAAS